MIEPQYTLLLGLHARLPQADKDRVDAALAELRAVTDKYGEHGEFAIAMLCAELSED